MIGLVIIGLLALPPIYTAAGEALGKQDKELNNQQDGYINAFLSANLIPPNNPAPPTRSLKTGHPNKSWPVPSKDEAIRLVSYWTSYYGGNVILAGCLVSLESGFYSLADNSTSSAAGLWQIIFSTWNSTTRAMGVDWTYNDYVYNAERNAQVGAYLLTHGGYRHWVVWPKCI